MKPDGAIKQLKNHYQTIPLSLTYADIDAIKLGIEALLRVQQDESQYEPELRNLLPGETKE